MILALMILAPGGSGELPPAEALPYVDGPNEVRVAPIVSFYACEGPNGGFCGTMAHGRTVYAGAAACGSFYAPGELVRVPDDPTDRVYTCEDTGALAAAQVDVFFWREADGWAWLADRARIEGGPYAEVSD